jgi:hypothetical protein
VYSPTGVGMKQQRRTSRVVTTALQVVVEGTHGPGAVLDCELVYDLADPYAASMIFHTGGGPVRWTFGRDLLLQGLDHPAGVGDVHVRPCLEADGRAGVAIVLSSRDGALEVHAARRQVQRFVAMMLEAVAEGAEGEHSGVDRELDELLG